MNRTVRYTVVTALTLVAAGAASGVEAAPTTVIHDFTGETGQGPIAGLLNVKGIFYGVTTSGGRFNCGTIYRVTAKGAHEVLYASTCGNDGSDPQGDLIADADGILYGTTRQGGTFGHGTVFTYSIASRAYAVRYHFRGGLRGSGPIGPLARDSSGRLYGTTERGGASGLGVIFRVAPDGTQTILRSFNDRNGSASVYSGLTIDSGGVLYGTTSSGGAFGFGTVYKLTQDGRQTILYSFKNFPDTKGTAPLAGVIVDTAGNLYGTTVSGGSSGKGSIFKLAPNGVLTSLFSFNGSNGANPGSKLAMDAAGNLYATASNEGSRCAQCGGTVVKVTQGGQGFVLHRFTGSPDDGKSPFGTLAFDANGNLYGVTNQGGEGFVGSVYRVFLR